MKLEFTPENDKERMMLELIQNEDHTDLSIEERLMYLERFSESQSIVSAMHSRDIRNLIKSCTDDEEVQKVIDEVKAVRSEMENFRQTILELEETKVRLRNTEYDLRQALTKISSIEQSLSVFRACINEQADQLDRLNKEVFDEEPEDIEP